MELSVEFAYIRSCSNNLKILEPLSYRSGSTTERVGSLNCELITATAVNVIGICSSLLKHRGCSREINRFRHDFGEGTVISQARIVIQPGESRLRGKAERLRHSCKAGDGRVKKGDLHLGYFCCVMKEWDIALE